LKHRDARWVCLFFHQPLWLEDEKRLQRVDDKGGEASVSGSSPVQ